MAESQRRLEDHLDHITNDVVPARGAASGGLGGRYLAELDMRLQPPFLARGLEQWNTGHFYEQHETLEWLWRATDEPVRDLFKGIIQGGVGAFHVMRRNRRGALGKWTGALGYLEPFALSRPFGIQVDPLRALIAAARQALLDDIGDEPHWESHQAAVRAFAIVWEPRVAQPAVTSLLRRLDRAWHESPLGLERNSEFVTEREATWYPTGTTRSIQQLLVHIGASKAVLANRCFGDGTLELGQVDSPAEWSALPRWLTHQHESIRQPLGFLSDNELDQARTMVGHTIPLGRLIEAGIERDLYHAGEINLIRQLFRQLSNQSQEGGDRDDSA